MLKQIIEATRLSPEFCASLLRVPAEQFREWMDGKRPIPQFVVPELCTILGVGEKSLLARAPVRGTDGGSLAPAIWFKLRTDTLGVVVGDFVGWARGLVFFMAKFKITRGFQSPRAG